MTNRTGRTVRRALAALVVLGGLGVYATAQQPKPLVIQSTGTPGVYTVSGPTPTRMLPPSVMPGVPTQPDDTAMSREPLPVAPLAAKPELMPGVPLPPVESAVVRDAQPLPPVRPPAKPSVLPGVPAETNVTRNAVPAPPAKSVTAVMPAPPTQPLAPAMPPPPNAVVRDAMPLAPIAPTQSPPVATVGLVVPEALPAPVAPVAPKTVAATQPAPVPPVVEIPAAPAIRKSTVVMESAVAHVVPETPAVTIPQAPSTPVLLAPVLAPSTTALPGVPRIPTTPAPVVQANPAPRTPSVAAPTPVVIVPPAPATPVVESAVADCPRNEAAGCSKCQRGRGHCHCFCAPATVPPPVGSSVRAAFGTQRVNALEESCVVYREDFDHDTATLNPTGERHISGIARRFEQTRSPVKVEPTGNAALDQRRTAAVISGLVKAGIPVEVAANRVQGGTGRGEGMAATDIEPAFARYSYGGYGVGGQGASYGWFTTFGPFALYR